MKQCRVRTISRKYYKNRYYKITRYDIYGQGYCKLMERKYGNTYVVIGHVSY